jgi:sugar O-acyltransferase (sialic acid O-acetyltransferase NeuD family)
MPIQERSLLILGDGPFAVEALNIVEAAGGAVPLGFVNSVRRPAPRTMLDGLPVFWVDDLPAGPDDCDLVCAIVTTRRRGFVETMLARGFRFRSLVHPFVSVSKRARIADGCIINAGAVIGSNAELGANTVVNRGALIGHDDRIGQFCTIGPGANVAGHVAIGEGSFVGQGAVIRERLSIGSGVVIGAGAVVLNDIAPNDMVVGLPARVVKSGVNGY